VTVHGISENVDVHAQKFKPFAEKYGVILISPHFPASKFDDYQRLGRTGGRADLALKKITEEVRELTSTQREKIYLFGYSGGGQFTHRYAMAHPEDIERYAVGAAGWYTFPDDTVDYPQGTRESDELEDIVFNPNFYLRVPGAVMVGDLDVELDASLNQSAEITAQQGKNRYERGKRWIDAMSNEALKRGMSASFKFQTLNGCAHSFSNCMDKSKMGDAVFAWFFN